MLITFTHLPPIRNRSHLTLKETEKGYPVVCQGNRGDGYDGQPAIHCPLSLLASVLPELVLPPFNSWKEPEFLLVKQKLDHLTPMFKFSNISQECVD